MRYVLICLVLIASIPAWADFSGKVVKITDGDTITVLRGHEQVKVRLMEIDAPDKTQPFGNRSKQTLSGLVFGKQIEVTEGGKDRYKRTLGHVYQDGLDIINAEMVKQGMAWVYDRYVTDRGLYQLQDEAKSTNWGLWSDVNPVAPWEWRHMNRD